MSNASKVPDESRKNPNLTGGSRKGKPNKTTVLLKEAILQAATEVGTDGKGKGGLTGYLTLLAKHQPNAFATLLGRVLPMQVIGDQDAPVVHRIELVPMSRTPNANGQG